MGWIDIAVTVFYLVSIVTLGCLAGYITRRRGSGEAKNYFLAGGTLRWPVIGMALFATNISCVHLVSLAQSGYDTGLLNGNFEWMAVMTLIMLGLFFAPFYIRRASPRYRTFSRGVTAAPAATGWQSCQCSRPSPSTSGFPFLRVASC